jgi:hypothetical protein
MARKERTVNECRIIGTASGKMTYRKQIAIVTFVDHENELYPPNWDAEVYRHESGATAHITRLSDGTWHMVDVTHDYPAGWIKNPKTPRHSFASIPEAVGWWLWEGTRESGWWYAYDKG